MPSSSRRVVFLVLLVGFAITFNPSRCIAATTHNMTFEECIEFLTSSLTGCSAYLSGSASSPPDNKTCCEPIEKMITNATEVNCLCYLAFNSNYADVITKALSIPAACNLPQVVSLSNCTGQTSATRPASQSSPPPPLTRNPPTSSSAIIAVPVAVALLTAVSGLILFLKFRNRELKSQDELDSAVLERHINPSVRGPIRYSYQQLRDATQNFHRSRFLGKGGFGPVYKGDTNGELVAVKCLNTDSKQGFKEFKAEINIIGDLRHRNLVKLRGWCYKDKKYFLVYEYIAKGSLDTILFDNERCRNELSWERRFGIILGLSSALQYLHEECKRVIIHRDIKTSNVLVDDKYVAKLGDFGLSRNVGDSQTPTTMVVGTQGYIAPEVFINRKASKESDIFSFGAVLAEVACGKRVVDEEGMALVDWVWGHLPAGMLIKAADERLGGNFNEEEMTRVLLLALACSHPNPSARPSIRVVMEILRGTAPLPVVPLYKPVPVYMVRLGSGFVATSPSSSSSYGHGINSVTSFVSGR